MIDTSFASFSDNFLVRSSFESPPSFFHRIRINSKIGIRGKKRRKVMYWATVFVMLWIVITSSFKLIGIFPSLLTVDG